MEYGIYLSALFVELLYHRLSSENFAEIWEGTRGDVDVRIKILCFTFCYINKQEIDGRAEGGGEEGRDEEVGKYRASFWYQRDH